MKCEKCGTKLREGVRFCPKCGSEVSVGRTGTQSKGNKVLIISIVTIVGVAVIAGLALFILRPGSSDKDKAGDSTEPVQVQTEQIDSENKSVSDEVENLLDMDTTDEQSAMETDDYSILPDNVADYGNPQVLDYRLYNRYEGPEKYVYGYPASVFNSYSESDEVRAGECYGTRIHQNMYSASDDSYVCFNMYERTDIFSIADMGMYTYNYEAQFITEPAPVINGLSSDEECYMAILVGYVDETRNASVYNLIRVEDNYIYQMKIYYPTPKDRESKLHMDYYIDCMYRLCEFSNHQSAPRSYEDFVKL